MTQDALAQIDQELLKLKKKGIIQVQTPGEILTTARYLLDLWSAQLSAVPTGADLSYAGTALPPGYVWADGQVVDPQRYPGLANVMQRTPKKAHTIVKV